MEFGTSPENLISYGRQLEKVVIGRQAAMWLAKKVTGQSYTEIGRRFDRDHKTIMSAFEKAEERRAFDGRFLAKTERLLSLFKADYS